MPVLKDGVSIHFGSRSEMSLDHHQAADLSHHLSELASRLDSFPKVQTPDVAGKINLDSGVPSLEYCPIKSISIEYLKPCAFSLSQDTDRPSELATEHFTIPYQLQPGDESNFDLKTALSYSAISGLPAAGKIVREWVAKVHQPAYTGWNTLINFGSSAAWVTCLTILLNVGDGFLTDYYAYNAALTQARALGMFPVGVASDTDGLSALDLEQVLATWDDKARGFKRPRVIFTQGGVLNPTGFLITAQRKKEASSLKERKTTAAFLTVYDLIIVEDDPCYYHQASAPYGSGEIPTGTDEEWLDGLVPSFLRYDYDGRVVRLDTFSKCIAPGGRLGYYTGPPLLIQKLTALNAISINFPSGFSQAILGELLYKYRTEGLTRWLRGISTQYTLRRNWVLDALHKALYIQQGDDGSRVLTAYASEDSQDTKSLMSFVPPDGGMFIWFHIHIQNHPRYDILRQQKSLAVAKNQLCDELWAAIDREGVMLRRGELFAADAANDRANRGEEAIFLRAAFGNGTKEDLEKGMNIFARELVKFFQ
ncbi:pyridoxal phosphate-dependent transferase [Mycena vitilis]|nr:pyridoxal phosphate-dependent transferase [Mycena vitilis]